MPVELGPSQVWRLHKEYREFEIRPENQCGVVYSFTILNPEFPYPEGFEKQAPITLALIKFSSGTLSMHQLTDYGEITPKIGDEVEITTRKLFETKDGLVVYGPKYRPVFERA